MKSWIDSIGFKESKIWLWGTKLNWKLEYWNRKAILDLLIIESFGFRIEWSDNEDESFWEVDGDFRVWEIIDFNSCNSIWIFDYGINKRWDSKSKLELESKVNTCLFDNRKCGVLWIESKKMFGNEIWVLMIVEWSSIRIKTCLGFQFWNPKLWTMGWIRMIKNEGRKWCDLISNVKLISMKVFEWSFDYEWLC